MLIIWIIVILTGILFYFTLLLLYTMRSLPSCTFTYKVHKNKEKQRGYLEGTFIDILEFWIKHGVMGYSGKISITMQSLTLATTHIL